MKSHAEWSQAMTQAASISLGVRLLRTGVNEFRIFMKHKKPCQGAFFSMFKSSSKLLWHQPIEFCGILHRCILAFDSLSYMGLSKLLLRFGVQWLRITRGHDSSPYKMDKNTLLHSFPLTLSIDHYASRFSKLYHYNSSCQMARHSPGLVVNFDDFVENVGAVTSALNELLPFKFRIMIITYTQHVWRQTINNKSPDRKWTSSLPLQHSNIKNSTQHLHRFQILYLYIFI